MSTITFSEQEMELTSVLFPIVGVGASAGGLEAFIQLLTHLPANTGMAYVFVQHLDPSHESLLSDLLARVTTMPVCEVRNVTVVSPNHVYVIAPNTSLTLEHGKLLPLPRTMTAGQHLSIDRFLSSLATDRGQQSIGILLSGTASDGTQGLKAIKQAGGFTFAQDAESAKFSEMPQSAIDAGWVDHILSSAAIARELHTHHAYISYAHAPPIEEAQNDKNELSADEESAFLAILALLRRKTFVDFLSYKRPTMQRRIRHRMAIHQLEHVADYLLLLQEHEDEAGALYLDILITVTSFFRDPLAFDALTQIAFPALLRSRAEHEPVRIWVMGCSTGEEVYSLAICLQEFLDVASPSTPLLLFGTDVNSMVLKKARTGVYTSTVLQGVSPQRLQRFFLPVEGGYQICQAIRDRCVFAEHNVSRDPPFSRIDLVSCRNVLIYLGPRLQRNVFQTFHYALKPYGYLLLGTSESVGGDTDLFSVVDAKQSLYAKKNTRVRFPLAGMLGQGEPELYALTKEGNAMNEEVELREEDMQKEADQVLLMRFVPASVVIDADMEIFQFRGHTSPYLEPAPGKASFNLLKMARDGLRLGLRSAILAASKSGHAVTREGLQVMVAGGGVKDVTVEVLPLAASSAERRSYLVVFTEKLPRVRSMEDPVTGSRSSPGAKSRGEKDRRLAALEQELLTSKAEMHALLEEREAANEELRAANEEIRSSNEELQSINEELETSREEIQATNEELTTLNQELSISNEQLKAARDYAEAIVETMREPLVVLNADLQVVRANPAFYRIFQATAEETEQHRLYELGNGQWNLPPLCTLLEEILPTNNSFQSFEVDATFPTIGHKVMLLNALRLADKQEGRDHLILLAFEDISERKQLDAQKDAFLGMVSHELKTPVSSVKAFTQVLERRFRVAGDEKSATMLGKMDTQLDKLISLIGDLSNKTAIEAGKLQTHETSFDIDALVRDIVEEMQHITETHRLVIKNEANRQVYADRERIGQVLTNLLSNAIKYSPLAKTVCVSASVREELVTVSVQDEGIGIAQEKQEHVFERFFRVSSPEQEHIAGMGLGLYIAAEIVKLQGGTMQVESRTGEGSTFSFTIPSLPSTSDTVYHMRKGEHP
ncbi:MAG: chemotaxis protein CheB [Ktedonobacteraceae bacterium]